MGLFVGPCLVAAPDNREAPYIGQTITIYWPMAPYYDILPIHAYNMPVSLIHNARPMNENVEDQELD